MKKHKIGYTTGVFDLFHAGHLNILRRAKEQCSFLVVGVSTDALAEEYKKRAPIIPFEQRIEIISAIRYVDQVVPQTTMNKMEAYKTIKFDAMFHGDDWAASELYKGYMKQFEPFGVDVVFLPHTQGISTSKIAESVVARNNRRMQGEHIV